MFKVNTSQPFLVFLVLTLNKLMLAGLLHKNDELKLQKQPPEVFYEKSVSKNFAKFTAKHLCQSPFFNKAAVLSLQLY